MEEFSQYGKHYSDDKFRESARRNGSRLTFFKDAAAMYYCLKDSKTPAHIKALILGALGYFILPVDMAPDIIPVVGWLDDATVVATVLAIVKTYITQEHRKAAGEFTESTNVS